MNAHTVALSLVLVALVFVCGFLTGRLTSKPATTQCPPVPVGPPYCPPATDIKETRRKVKQYIDGGTETVTTIERHVDAPMIPQDPTPWVHPTPKADPTWRIDVLGGYDFRQDVWVAGGQVSRGCLGPIRCGVWGLSNQSFGVSAGVEW
jgi:hypothetical protein